MTSEIVKKKIPLKAGIRLLRPKHYIKNLLVFVSIFFTQNLLNIAMLVRVICGFVVFCLVSSIIYIFNDIRDVEADRKHEQKRTRPIASGEISIPCAYGIAAVLLIVVIAIQVIMHFGLTSMMITLAYFIVNCGYSLGLKQIPILDVVLLVSGFLLRVLFGASIIGSSVSSWVYLTIVSLSFYLGLGKRRNELIKTKSGGDTRKVLKFYSYAFLDKFMYLCLTLSIAFYALWSADTEIVAKYGTDKLVWTVPMIIILMMKYSADIESDSFGDPVDVVMHDKGLIFLSVLYGIVLFGLIYFPF